MKKILKQFLKLYLKTIARLILFLHKPKIIAVAGSINKVFIKERIIKTLEEKKYTTFNTDKNFNTEIGLPLAILGLSRSGYHSYKLWLPIIKESFSKIFTTKYPQYLVISYGISDPGDMKYLLSITGKPFITIINNISQRYLEGFKNMDSLSQEFKTLAQQSQKATILNIDNKRIEEISQSIENKITYGLSNDADWQILNIDKTKTGQSFTCRNKTGEEHYLDIKRFGEHHVHAEIIAEIIDTLI